MSDIETFDNIAKAEFEFTTKIITPINWITIEVAPKNRFILTACLSGHLGITWIYTIAHWNMFKERWEDEASNDLQDRGYIPLWWCELPNEPPKIDKIIDEHFNKYWNQMYPNLKFDHLDNHHMDILKAFNAGNKANHEINST